MKGVVLNNWCKVDIRYSDRISAQRRCTEAKMDKVAVCNDLLQNKMDDSGCPLTADRGYTTLNLVRFLNNKGPFLNLKNLKFYT